MEAELEREIKREREKRREALRKELETQEHDRKRQADEVRSGLSETQRRPLRTKRSIKMIIGLGKRCDWMDSPRPDPA